MRFRGGMSVADVLELLVGLTWLAGAGVLFDQLIAGKLTSTGVDLLTVLSWPVLAVLGGGIVQRFGFPRVRGPAPPGGFTPGYYGGYDPYGGYPPGLPTSPSEDAGGETAQPQQQTGTPPQTGVPSI